MFRRMLRIMHRDERGITGLETAIIMIAFVVVASVFAYSVLSAGLFSAQKGQEAIYAGLEETRASMALRGSVIGYGENATAASGSGVGNKTIARIAFTLSTTLPGVAVDLTPPYTWAGSGANVTSSGLTSVNVISYADENNYIGDCAWTISFIGKDDDDYLLESEEKAVVTVWMLHYNGTNYTVGAANSGTFFNSFANCTTAYDTATWEIRPETGASLIVERTMPTVFDTTFDLN